MNFRTTNDLSSGWLGRLPSDHRSRCIAAGAKQNVTNDNGARNLISILFAQDQHVQHALLTAREYANIFRSVLSQTSKSSLKMSKVMRSRGGCIRE
jgi:hypothetical protein